MSAPTKTPPPMSTTAKLGWGTLGLQLLCLVAVVVIYLVDTRTGEQAAETLAETSPEALGATARTAISTVGSIAMSGGIGGGAATVGYAGRHFGSSSSPTTAELHAAEHRQTPPDDIAEAL